jgi:2-hydroxy-3-keto-5-methylthiopentenyl-1-phosphate phosphatase
VRTPWAIVCDFDGTALTEDLGDQIAQRYASEEAWTLAEDRFRAGLVTFGGLLEEIFSAVRVERHELEAFARARAAWRPGFERFLAACRDAGVPFLLVSSGLDVYIEPVLAKLAPTLRAHLELRANRAVLTPEGARLSFFGEDCGFCGACKGHVVRELQGRGHKVVVLGDGSGDRHAADAADHVFARAGSSLAHACARDGLAHDVFATFDEVMARFPG